MGLEEMWVPFLSNTAETKAIFSGLPGDNSIYFSGITLLLFGCDSTYSRKIKINFLISVRITDLILLPTLYTRKQLRIILWSLEVFCGPNYSPWL